jgi:hypothetical protein
MTLTLASCLAAPVPADPNDPPLACTAIGCNSQLTFELGTELERGERYDLEACIDGDCDAATVEIPPSGFATSGAFTVDADRNAVTVTLLGEDYSGAHDVSLTVVDARAQDIVRVADTIEFDRAQPNGPGCEPVCWQATVRV